MKRAASKRKTHRARQPSLFESDAIESRAAPLLKQEWKKLSRRTHGGSQSEGSRKEFRPLDKKRWLHLILKSDKAKGRNSLLTPANKLFIERLIAAKARKFGVRVESLANVGNHLHIKLKFDSRTGFQNFLRSITSQIARFVTKARRGYPFGKFWNGLAYTRVITSRKEELGLRGYIEANQIEARSSKASREKYLSKFNAWVESLKTNFADRCFQGATSRESEIETHVSRLGT